MKTIAKFLMFAGFIIIGGAAGTSDLGGEFSKVVMGALIGLALILTGFGILALMERGGAKNDK